jgi:hypothetical protein
MMQATVGDRVIIKGRHLGEPEGDARRREPDDG